MANIHRRWAYLSLNQEVSVAPYDLSFESQYHYLGDIELEVGYLQKIQDYNEQFNTDEMSNIFCQVVIITYIYTFKDIFLSVLPMIFILL
jgi:vesicle-fusing ATPase